jgi:EAL domain-containing protein (putative c-di-GMP-specific phosphodiesterase class I)
VAEGVERIEELEALRELGCEEVQGFLYCAPLEAEEVLGFLQHRPPWSAAAKPAAALRRPAPRE